MIGKHQEQNKNHAFNNEKPKYLTQCRSGDKLTVICVDAGMMAKKRLANLGIIPGVKLIKNRAAPFCGPVQISVKGTSLVLGRGIASKILVNTK